MAAAAAAAAKQSHISARQQRDNSLPSSQESHHGTQNTDSTGTGTTETAGGGSCGTDVSKAEVYIFDSLDHGGDRTQGIATTSTQTQPQAAAAEKNAVDSKGLSQALGRDEAPVETKVDAKNDKITSDSGPKSGKKNQPATKKPIIHHQERRLFVFHGLRPDFLSQVPPHMGIDPDFVCAHLLRRPYRPRLVQLNGQQRHGPSGEKVVRWSFAHFQYPELVLRVGNRQGEREGGLNAGSEEAYLVARRRETTPRHKRIGTDEHNGSGGGGGGGEDDARHGSQQEAQGRARGHPAHSGGGSGSGNDDPAPIGGRIFGDPPVLNMPGREDAVVMCRASLWMSEKGDALLLLDRPIWRDPQLGLQKTYSHESLPASSSSSSRRHLHHRSLDGSGEESSSLHSFITIDATRRPDLENDAPSLHDALQEWLNNYPADFDYRAVLSSVVELAYDRWLELFEALDLRPIPTPVDGRVGTTESHSREGVNDLLSLYWKSQMALETNADNFAYMNARGMVMPRGRADWGVLLAKIRRRVDLLNLAATIVPPPLSGAKGLSTGIGTGQVTKTADTMTMGFDGGTGLGEMTAPSESRERHCHRHGRVKAPLASLNQPTPVITSSVGEYGTPQEKERERGLDRVAYMGGIFLPFTVISSILSMSEPFGPGQTFHWVFWVVAAPLALGAVAFIYADNIRRAEVWIEVSDWHDEYEKDSKAEEQSARETGKKWRSCGGRLPPPVPGPPRTLKGLRGWRQKQRGEPPKLPPIQSESESILEKTRTDNASLCNMASLEGRQAGASEAPTYRPQLHREPALATLNYFPSIRSSSSSSSPTSSDNSNISSEHDHGHHAPQQGHAEAISPTSHRPAPRLPQRQPPEEDEQGLLPRQTAAGFSAATNADADDGASVADDDAASRAEIGTIRTATRRPTMILQPATNGDNPRAWRRTKLGWGGAWKTMVGYYVPRKGEDMPLGVKAYEVRGSVKRQGQPPGKGGGGGGGVVA